MATETAARTGQTDETNRLISSQKVDGTAVYNRSGDRLGDVDHMMIDKFTGQVEYAVLSCWFTRSEYPRSDLGGYVIDADRAKLGSAPRFQASAHPNWSDRGYSERVNQYWGVGRV